MVVIHKTVGDSTVYLIGVFSGEYVWTCDFKKATNFDKLSIVTVRNYILMIRKHYKNAVVGLILE